MFIKYMCMLLRFGAVKLVPKQSQMHVYDIISRFSVMGQENSTMCGVMGLSSKQIPRVGSFAIVGLTSVKTCSPTCGIVRLPSKTGPCVGSWEFH